jgi:hypothetical protein
LHIVNKRGDLSNGDHLPAGRQFLIFLPSLLATAMVFLGTALSCAYVRMKRRGEHLCEQLTRYRQSMPDVVWREEREHSE